MNFSSAPGVKFTDNQSCRARRKYAPGVAVALDALFEGADMEAVRGDMDEVHVRTDGREGLVPTERLAFRVDIDLLHILHELHKMPRAGV